MPHVEFRDDHYSSWVGLIYIYNLIVGTGALTLPAAFAKAGWGLSIGVIIMLAFMGFITVTFIIEVMACANAVLHMRRLQSHKIDGESDVVISSDSEMESATEETPVISNRSQYYSLNQRIELGQMTDLFFNKVGKILFYISLCVYLYGDLTIYVSAISRTMTDIICDEKMVTNSTRNCWKDQSISQMNVYRIILTIFILVVGPFSYFNLQKTKYLQIATSTIRWCSFVIMINIALVTMFELGVQGHPPVASITHVPPLIGVCVYSFMCHHSLPGLVAPFSNKNNVIKLLGLDYAFICGFYLVMAVTGVFAFQNLEPLYTLNFIPVNGKSVDWLTKSVDYFLTLFPVFTLTTTFPIIAITLQSNLKTLFLDTSSMDRYNFYVRHMVFPTLAIIPPTLVALATNDLDSLVSFTGMYAGSAIQYLIPAFLVLFARKLALLELGPGAVNKFKSPFQGVQWVAFVIMWCITCVVLSTLNYFFYKNNDQ